MLVNSSLLVSFSLKLFLSSPLHRLVNDTCKYYRRHRYQCFLLKVSTILISILLQKVSAIFLPLAILSYTFIGGGGELSCGGSRVFRVWQERNYRLINRQVHCPGRWPCVGRYIPRPRCLHHFARYMR